MKKNHLIYLFSVFVSLFCVLHFPISPAFAAEEELQKKLNRLTSEFDGRVGVCVLNLAGGKPVCVNGETKFQLQSVMKLVVGVAVLDAVDRGVVRLDDKIVVLPEDASPGPQDFAELVKSKGSLSCSVEELVRRAVIDSDSTSVDVLLKRLGGPATVQKFLDQKQIKGMQIDREERFVQADSLGLKWRSDYSDAEKFDAAVKALREKDRDKAWQAHLVDKRDSSTPLAMVDFLNQLASGSLLSAASTEKILSIMKSVKTGPGRLMAGVPENWSIAHKTGTGRSWKGMNAATNDVGLLFSPDGDKIAIATFVTESRQSDANNASVIAQMARFATENYLTSKNGGASLVPRGKRK